LRHAPAVGTPPLAPPGPDKTQKWEKFMVTPSLAADVMVNHNRSFLGVDGLDISSAMVGARYYPTAAFQGFSVAGHLGGMRFAFENDSFQFPMLHVELAYSWLLGENRRFYVAPAFGAARLFTSGTIEGDTEDEPWEGDAAIPFPTIRVQIG
jgi:hypothetical protein